MTQLGKRNREVVFSMHPTRVVLSLLLVFVFGSARNDQKTTKLTSKPISRSTTPTTSGSSTPSTPKPTGYLEGYIKKFEGWKKDVKQKHKSCFVGDMRSPINIDVVETKPAYFSKLRFENYNTTGMVKEDTRSNFTEALHGFFSWPLRPYIHGGGLPGRYYLHEVHSSLREWITHGTGGVRTGHTVNGAHHTMEVHFIHAREGLSLEAARKIRGGVAIVAVFFEAVPMMNNSRKTGLNRSIYSGSDEPFRWIKPELLLPHDTTPFYRYNGSFAHPPCTDGVIWTVLVEPVIINYVQLYSFMTSSGRYSNTPLSDIMDDPPSVNSRTVLLNYGIHRKPSPSPGVTIRPTVSFSFSYGALVLLIFAVAISFGFIYLLYIRKVPKQVMSFDNIAMD